MRNLLEERKGSCMVEKELGVLEGVVRDFEEMVGDGSVPLTINMFI